MKVDSKDLDKYVHQFDKWGDKSGLLKGHIWTAIQGNAKHGKKVLASNTPNIPNWYRKHLRGGTLGAGSYVIGLGQVKNVKKSTFMSANSINDLRISVFNKKKTAKSWSKPKRGLRYADRFVYKRFGDPMPKVESSMRQDLERGLERAVNDSYRKAFK